MYIYIYVYNIYIQYIYLYTVYIYIQYIISISISIYMYSIDIWLYLEGHPASLYHRCFLMSSFWPSPDLCPTGVKPPKLGAIWPKQNPVWYCYVIIFHMKKYAKKWHTNIMIYNVKMMTYRQTQYKWCGKDPSTFSPIFRPAGART